MCLLHHNETQTGMFQRFAYHGLERTGLERDQARLAANLQVHTE